MLGTAHWWRLRPPEAEAPGTYEDLPEAGVIVDRPEQDAMMSLARNLGGESVITGTLVRYQPFPKL